MSAASRRHWRDWHLHWHAQGVETHVVTCGAAGGVAEEIESEGLTIHRVNVQQQANDFIHWVHLLNGEMERRATDLLASFTDGEPTVIHVHDWLGSYSGIALKHHFRLPLLSTIHATEYGRNNGIHNEIQGYINHHEWWLQMESWRVVVCSHFMRDEVMHALGTPYDKVDIIYNGVDSEVYDFSFDDAERWAFRRNYAGDHQPILFFIGRMVREKGAPLLLGAFYRVRQKLDAKLIIAGGGDRSHLDRRVWELGLQDHVYFTGRVPDGVRNRLYKVADVACYPSLYEPFGIVALEAMAAKVPVVVANAGGLAEVVENNVSGTVVDVDNADSLAGGILSILYNRDHAQWMANRASERVQTIFNWDVIAAQTKAVYDLIWSEYLQSDWSQDWRTRNPKAKKSRKNESRPSCDNGLNSMKRRNRKNELHQMAAACGRSLGTEWVGLGTEVHD